MDPNGAHDGNGQADSQPGLGMNQFMEARKHARGESPAAEVMPEQTPSPATLAVGAGGEHAEDIPSKSNSSDLPSSSVQTEQSKSKGIPTICINGDSSSDSDGGDEAVEGGDVSVNSFQASPVMEGSLSSAPTTHGVKRSIDSEGEEQQPKRRRESDSDSDEEEEVGAGALYQDL